MKSSELYKSLPQSVRKRINILSERTEITNREILEEYVYLLNYKFADVEFPTTEAKHDFIMHSTWAMLINSRQTEKHTFVPIGFSGIQITKKGQPRSDVYAIQSIDKKLQLTTITFLDMNTRKIKDITFWSIYRNLRVGRFRDSKDFVADIRTHFGENARACARAFNLLL